MGMLVGKTVCLDPGHAGYGIDPGCVGPAGTTESSVAWDIACRTADILQNRWGLNVVMTKREPIDIASDKLAYRAEIANNAGADVFVSIHLNAGSPQATGTETYYYPGSTQGYALATSIQKQLTCCLGTKDRGVKTANFAVLRLTYMPSVLTEVCFLSNPDEEEYINRDATRQKAAEAIAQGIVDFFINA